MLLRPGQIQVRSILVGICFQFRLLRDILLLRLADGAHFASTETIVSNLPAKSAFAARFPAWRNTLRVLAFSHRVARHCCYCRRRCHCLTLVACDSLHSFDQPCQRESTGHRIVPTLPPALVWRCHLHRCCSPMHGRACSLRSPDPAASMRCLFSAAAPSSIVCTFTAQSSAPSQSDHLRCCLPCCRRPCCLFDPIVCSGL